nr:reverse transcriptase domain-containing protein [Tanacetum cinerariifolium]
MAKDLWDALARHMLGFEYEWKRYATMMRQNKNLLDINIDALNNILKQNQGDVNDAIKPKKKAVVITFDPLTLVVEQTKVSKRKEKVVVSSESEDSDDELKKITALLAKAFNRKKFYSKPTNNNLRTSSTTSSANKKQEYVKSDDKKQEKKVDKKKRDISKVKCYNCKKEGNFAKYCKKAKVKDYEYYNTKMLLAKKDKDEQVLLAEDHAWMESSSDSDQEINANMVFMAQIEKVLSDSEASSSSSDDKIAEKAQGETARGITCYECRVLGHYKSDCPKLKNGNQGNRAKNGNVVARAYAVGTAGTNLNSNVVTGTFLLNNHYASVLFDTGAGRSFVSTAFSSLIDIIPTTLDHGYDVELAD